MTFNDHINEVLAERDDLVRLTASYKSYREHGSVFITCDVKALFDDLDPEENGWRAGGLIIELRHGHVYDNWCNWGQRIEETTND